MHSLIFIVIKDLIVKKHGEAVWNELALKSELPTKLEPDFYYSDNALYDLVSSASAMLSMSSEAVLELVGYYFIEYIRESEYQKLLNMSGGSLAETLQNINGLHGHMKLSFFKHIAAPTFRTTNVTSTSLRLHYIPGKPNRRSLAPLVVGLIKGLAEAHYQIPASKVNVLLLKSADKGADRDVFHVSWKKAVEKSDKSVTASASTQKAVFQYGFDGESLNRIFPFHFVLNKKLQIVQLGSSLKKLMKLEISQQNAANLDMKKWMKIASPKIVDYSYKIIEKFIGDLITVRVKIENTKTKQIKEIELSMEIVKLRDRSDRSSLCFVGSPNLKSLQEAIDFGISLSDFAVHDPAKDRLFAFDHAENLHQKIISFDSSSEESISEPITDDLYTISDSPPTCPITAHLLNQSASTNDQISYSSKLEFPKRMKLNKQKSGDSTTDTLPSSSLLSSSPSPSSSTVNQPNNSYHSSRTQPVITSNQKSKNSIDFYHSSVIFDIIQNDANVEKFNLIKLIIEKTHSPFSSSSSSSNDTREFIASLLQIFDQSGKTHHFLNQAIEWELDNTSSPPSSSSSSSSSSIMKSPSSSLSKNKLVQKNQNNDVINRNNDFDDEKNEVNEEKNSMMMMNKKNGEMFRQDTSSSIIISVYCKEKAKKIIKKLLLQFLQFITSSSHQSQSQSIGSGDLHFEKSVISFVHYFLNLLVSSAPSWPLEVAKLIAKISRDVSDKRGLEDANNAVTSILFLRLIAPAIAFPTQFDIAPSKSLMEQQKTLLCISKIINNIVNGVTFNEQSNMAVYNSLINFKESEDKIDRFVNLLIEHSSSFVPRIHQINIHPHLSDVRVYLTNNIDLLLELSFDYPLIRKLIKDLTISQTKLQL